MPHGGLSVQQLLDRGVTDINVLRHAATDPTTWTRREGEDQPIPDDFLGLFDGEGEEEEEGDGDGGGAITDVSQVGITGTTSIDETVTGEKTSDFLTRETVRTYINIPTAEAVLDDWEKGFSAHIGGLVRTGELSDTDASLAFQQMDVFAREYFGEIGAMIERGEDPYRVVGLEGEPKFLGEREGAVSEAVSTGVTTEETETQRQEAEQRTVTETGARTTTPTGEAAETVTRDETTGTTRDEGVSLSQDQRIEHEQRQREEVTEQVFARPEIRPIFALSPTDFMGRRDPGMLSSIVRQRQGRERALATRGAGGVVSGTRRV